MAFLKRFRTLRSEENTGFGANSNSSGGRFFSRQSGGANVKKRGIGILNRYSWYHTLLGMPLTKFLFLLFVSYIIINLFFAGVYYLIGVDHLAGIENSHDLKEFSEVFFFSTQTFTTVGYGRISPTGFLTSAVATLEAFVGLLSFAIATGLFYGRFSRPRAFLKFSENALIAPFKEGTALMLRTAPYKNNNLSEASAEVTLAMQTDENGKMVNKFFLLPLQIRTINSLALSWTLVHQIDENSPLYGFTEEDIRNTKMEILVFIKAFDEVFSNNVVSRWSYISEEIVWGAKFKLMFHPNQANNSTVLELERINDHERVSLPELNEQLNLQQG
jgi:inward rectifier potassium channel